MGGVKINCIDCKYKSKAFQRLTDEQLLRVNERRAEVSFKQGELISKQGVLMSHIVYIRKGFAKLYMEDGDEMTILTIAKPGTFIGVQALYGSRLSPFSIQALTDTEICLKDIRVFRELIAENPDFAAGIIEVLDNNLLQAYKRMFSLTTKHIDSRFSELLLYLSNVLYEASPFTLTISRKEIAGLISTTPESISRLLGDFKERGIINVRGQTIEITDADKLKDICDCESLSVG
jgi:CRP/FNR family transcriptional regulator